MYTRNAIDWLYQKFALFHVTNENATFKDKIMRLFVFLQAKRFTSLTYISFLNIIIKKTIFF